MFRPALGALAPLVLALAATAANAQVIVRGDAPEYVRVRSLSYNGSGCPVGSMSGSVRDGGREMALLWDEMVAQIGPGVSLAESRKNCQINVDLDFPRGWSYTLDQADWRGYVQLDRGVTATVATAYYFQGSAQTARLQSNFYGPLARDYQLRDTLGTSALVWSPCGAQRSLNINTQARLTSTSRNASGLITLDAFDTAAHAIFRIRWQRCS